MTVKQLLLDAWSALSFKRSMGDSALPGETWSVAPWAKLSGRRLMAYAMLTAYYENNARHFLAEPDAAKRADHREYGDAYVAVETILSALMGENQQIVTEEARGWVPEDKRKEGDDPLPLEVIQAHELQEWLRDWAESELWSWKTEETERNAVKLGDGVYVFTWSAEKQRVRCRVYDPDQYFPDLSTAWGEDFPSVVHIASEFADVETGKRMLRRMTWRLTDIVKQLEPPAVTADRLALESAALVSTEFLMGQRDWVVREGDEEDDFGRIWRDYPWREDLSSQTCYYSCGVWELDGSAAVADVMALDPSKATWELTEDEDGDLVEARDLDLMIDFMPVLHVPNTVSVIRHFGRSSLTSITQVLDDMGSCDTDLSAAASTTGTPVIGVGGNAPGDDGKRPTYAPGEVWHTGDGRLDMLDTSRSLDALLKYRDSLGERMSVNGRIPEALMGRVKPSEVPSGITLALSFGPLTSMIGQMRKTRQAKYPIGFRIVHRMSLAGGVEDVPLEHYHTQYELGTYLPSDRSAVVNEVRELMAVHSVSVETAVRMLMAAGVPIADAAMEVQRILEENYDAMDKLAKATNHDNDLLYDRFSLGDPPEPEPMVALPPGPGTPGGGPPGAPRALPAGPVRPPSPPGRT